MFVDVNDNQLNIGDWILLTPFFNESLQFRRIKSFDETGIIIEGWENGPTIPYPHSKSLIKKLEESEAMLFMLKTNIY